MSVSSDSHQIRLDKCLSLVHSGGCALAFTFIMLYVEENTELKIAEVYMERWYSYLFIFLV